MSLPVLKQARRMVHLRERPRWPSYGEPCREEHVPELRCEVARDESRRASRRTLRAPARWLGAPRGGSESDARARAHRRGDANGSALPLVQAANAARQRRSARANLLGQVLGHSGHDDQGSCRRTGSSGGAEPATRGTSQAAPSGETAASPAADHRGAEARLAAMTLGRPARGEPGSVLTLGTWTDSTASPR